MTMTLPQTQTVAAPNEIAGTRRRGRPRGHARSRPSVLLQSLVEATDGIGDGAIDEALRRIWLSGFYVGAASAAPERIKRCARCEEPFVARDTREIYCGPRCRNTVLKRRYRARLRARRAGPCPAER
jgi:hypothetical protein